MSRTTTVLTGVLAFAALTSSANAQLTLTVDTVSQTFTFDGSLTATPGPFGSTGTRLLWDLTPPVGPDATGPSFGSLGLGSMLSISQTNTSGPFLGGLNLRMFPSGTGPDILRIDALWNGDPGEVTMTGTFVVQSYAGLNPDAISILERSIGSTMPGVSPSAGAPGIEIIGVPAPGAMALLGIAGCAGLRRRRV